MGNTNFKTMIKVLNLYAGIGGNRKLWKDVEVTAVEKNPQVADIYDTMYGAVYASTHDMHKLTELFSHIHNKKIKIKDILKKKVYSGLVSKITKL